MRASQIGPPSIFHMLVESFFDERLDGNRCYLVCYRRVTENGHNAILENPDLKNDTTWSYIEETTLYRTVLVIVRTIPSSRPFPGKKLRFSN